MVCHSTCEDDEMEQWSWRASIKKKSQKGMMEKKVSGEWAMYVSTYISPMYPYRGLQDLIKSSGGGKKVPNANAKTDHFSKVSFHVHSWL